MTRTGKNAESLYQKLITLLTKFRPVTAGPDDPLFPSSSGRPDGAMLEKLKAVAWPQEGSHPGSVLRRLSADIPTSKVPWEVLLRDFVIVARHAENRDQLESAKPTELGTRFWQLLSLELSVLGGFNSLAVPDGT